jgi:RNA polymerase sigma-70 factor (ECF subfamily)
VVSDGNKTAITMHPAERAGFDDATLLARARDGDGPAFGELVRRHQRAALRVAVVICGSTEEAEDIVQDSFVDVHRHLASYRATGTVRSWMLRIVANRAKNHVRSRVRRVQRDDRHARLVFTTLEGADQAAERRLEHEQLADALGRLSEPDREVLGCRFVAGLSEAETADVLGTPLGTVKSRTSRALVRLQGELSGALAIDESAGGRP